jgi:hypothetical protein
VAVSGGEGLGESVGDAGNVAYQTLAGITTARTATNNKKTAVILAKANLEKTIVKGSLN